MNPTEYKQILRPFIAATIIAVKQVVGFENETKIIDFLDGDNHCSLLEKFLGRQQFIIWLVQVMQPAKDLALIV